ncbi:MAG: FHA domain-containing protein [Phycisphaerae bacterium]
MKTALVLVRPDGVQREFSLAPGVTIIGRAEQCTLRVPLMEISRKHCELNSVNGSVKIRDLGSSNGTFVNGKRVLEARLSPGDRLRVGAVTFVVRIDGEPRDVLTAPQKPEAPATAPSAPPAPAPVKAPPAPAAASAPASDMELEMSPDLDELSPMLDELSPAVQQASGDAEALGEGDLEVLDSAQSDSFSAYLEELNEGDGDDGAKKK